MWKPVARGDFPFWALGLNHIWKDTAGRWLTSAVNDHSTLWELRETTGDVIVNQLDLPFSGGLDGAPIAWANAELARRKKA